MKKTLKLLTVLCAATICTSAVSIAANAVNTDTNYLRGDADGDGVVTISDVTAIQRHLADLDITDATKIQRFLAEFENLYHIGEWASVETTQPATYWIKPGNNELPFIQN